MIFFMLGSLEMSDLFCMFAKNKNMRLIIDCGSTKADWVLLDNSKVLKRFKTEGFNPNYISEDSILNIINNESSYKEHIRSISEIFFYGSGCGNTDNCNKVEEIIKSIFINAKIEVTHDMMAACRAILGKNKGVACILGTGSNSCCYDGESITDQAVSLGYILGDDGSGSYIGKHILRDYFYKNMPDVLSQRFKNDYDITISEVIKNIYHESQVSKYLASFSKFAYLNKEDKYIKDLCSKCFDEFIDNFILRYEYAKENEIGFVGSIAYYFQDIIKQRLENKNLKLGKVVKEPIDGLIGFHAY